MKQKKYLIIAMAILCGTNLGGASKADAGPYTGVKESKNDNDHLSISGEDLESVHATMNEAVLYAEGKGKITFENAKLTMSATDAGAATVKQGGEIVLNEVKIYTSKGGNGLEAHGGGDIVFTGGEINISGDNGKGVLVGSAYKTPGVESSPSAGSHVTLNNVEIIITANEDAVGLAVGGTPSSGEKTPTIWMTGGKIDYRSAGIQPMAVNSSETGEVYLKDVTVTTLKNGARGLVANSNGYISMIGGTLTTQGNQAAAATASGGTSKLYLGGTSIETKGNSSVGVRISGGAATAEIVDTSITTEGTGSVGLQVVNTTGVVKASNVTVNTSGESAHGISVASGALSLTDGATIKATGLNANALDSSNGKIEGAQGLYHIEGNIVAGGTSSEISMDFTKGSYFKGSTSHGAGSKVNFVMDGTVWDMTGSSTMTNLEFSGNSSMVHFQPSNNGTYKTLTTEKLSGTGGYFNMNVDMAGVGTNHPTNGAGIYGDLLQIMGTDPSVSGHHQVISTNNGSARVSGEETLTIIQTEQDDAIDYFSMGQKLELGGYEYDLRAVAGQTNHLELFATGSSNPGDGGVNLQGAKYMVHYAEMQTLMKRMGDLRGEEERSKGGNIWARVYGGKLSSAGDGFLRDMDMTYTGVQAGADHRHDRKDGRGTAYIGGFFGYTNATPNFSRGGDAGIDSYSLGAYWTHVHHNGFYADLIAKYGWMNSDYDIRDSAGKKVTADSDSNVFSLSMEVGRRYHFNQLEKQGFYIEPQAQITFAHFDGDHFTASNGLSTKVDAFSSKLARVGTHIGYEVKDGKNPVNVYLKGYFMKEFDGNIEYSFNNGAKRSTSYEDTWFVYGVGATAKMGERHNLYLDFERAEGGRMEQDWALSGGYRYSW